MSITADPPGAPETERLRSQAEQLAQRRLRRERRFSAGVRVSYVVLFLLLAFLFSGAQIEIFGITINTIQLDWAFIRTYTPFIVRGVWLTIAAVDPGYRPLYCSGRRRGARPPLEVATRLRAGDVLRLAHPRHAAAAANFLLLSGLAPTRHCSERYDRGRAGAGHQLRRL